MRKNIQALAANAAFTGCVRFQSRDYHFFDAILSEHPVLIDSGQSRQNAAQIIEHLVNGAERAKEEDRLVRRDASPFNFD